MAKIIVYAGDFLTGGAKYSSGTFTLRTTAESVFGETIPVSELEIIDDASEENVKIIGGGVEWVRRDLYRNMRVCYVPFWLQLYRSAKTLLNSKIEESPFVARFKDGRKLLAATDKKTFTELKLSFRRGNQNT